MPLQPYHLFYAAAAPDYANMVRCLWTGLITES